MVQNDTLARSILFEKLSEEQLDEVLKLCVEREYAPQREMFEEGDPADYLYLVEQGKIAIEMALPSSTSPARKRATVEVAGEGEVVGWSALVEPYQYTFSATTLERTKVIAIDGPGLRRLLDQNPRIGYQVSKGLFSVVSSRLNATRLLLISERAWAQAS